MKGRSSGTKFRTFFGCFFGRFRKFSDVFRTFFGYFIKYFLKFLTCILTEIYYLTSRFTLNILLDPLRKSRPPFQLTHSSYPFLYFDFSCFWGYKVENFDTRNSKNFHYINTEVFPKNLVSCLQSHGCRRQLKTKPRSDHTTRGIPRMATLEAPRSAPGIYPSAAIP